MYEEFWGRVDFSLGKDQMVDVSPAVIYLKFLHMGFPRSQRLRVGEVKINAKYQVHCALTFVSWYNLSSDWM